jgi:hypothetical protein
MQKQRKQALIDAFEKIDTEGQRRILYSVEREAERCIKRRPRLVLVGGTSTTSAGNFDVILRKVQY